MTRPARNPDAVGTPVGLGEVVWTQQRWDAWQDVRRTIEQRGIELVRISFVDQHGLLRSKAVPPIVFESAMHVGHGVPGTLLLKDTSGRTVHPVFEATEVLGEPQLAGVGDVLMLPDPTTFRVLPHAPKTAVVLSDLYFPDGTPAPLSVRSILADQVAALTARGHHPRVGVELEFHVFRSRREVLDPSEAGMPPSPREVDLLTGGYQLLSDQALDDLHPITTLVMDTVRALDLPLRSIEAEMGPSQMEVTFGPQDPMAAADGVALFRSVFRQAARREGLHVTFMTRPKLPNVCSSGWHLHVSLGDDKGANTFAAGPDDEDTHLSPTGHAWLAGVLAHAAAATPLTTPTINGYKRFLPHSLAPERIGWGLDNKGAMLRVVGTGGTTRIENRVGEAAACPHLYVASQLIAGGHGLREGLSSPPATTTPYASGERLPVSLAAALDAFCDDEMFQAALGPTVHQWLLDIKRAEVARHDAWVNDWEQREYFELF